MGAKGDPVIASVRGIIESRLADSIVVAVGGFGLRVLVPSSTLSRIGAVGESVYLHTHFYLREDNIALYGFATPEELGLFDLLLTVTGVGPRIALAMLSGASVESIRIAIGTGNTDLLTTVPGVGKKVAGRLVLELKGKIDARGLQTPAFATANVDIEVLAALTTLGYSVVDAQRAIQSIPDDPALTTEDKIVRALKHFAS